MAWGSKGTLGATQNKTAASSLVHTTITTAVAIGDIVVVAVAKDNVATTTGINSNEVTSVTDSAGNTYVKIYEWTNGQGAAAGGATVAAYFTNAAFALAVGGTITANFSGSTTAKALTARCFTAGGGITAQVTGRQTSNVAAGALAALTVSGLTSAEYLFLHCFGVENNAAVAAGADTFTDFTSVATTGSTAATNIGVGARWKIATGTTSGSSTPGTVSVDNVAFAVALVESGGMPGVGALTLSGLAPKLAIAIGLTAGVLTFTGQAPTVRVERFITPSAGTLTLTGVAPKIQTSIGVAAGTLAFTGQAPTVTVVDPNATGPTIIRPPRPRMRGLRPAGRAVLNRARATQLGVRTFVVAQNGYVVDLMTGVTGYTGRVLASVGSDIAHIIPIQSTGDLVDTTIAFWARVRSVAATESWAGDPLGGMAAQGISSGGLQNQTYFGIADAVGAEGTASAVLFEQVSSNHPITRLGFTGNSGINQDWCNFTDPFTASNELTHVTLVRTLTNVRIFRNGKLFQTLGVDGTLLSGPSSSEPLHPSSFLILGGSSGGSQGYCGSSNLVVSDWLLCNRALSDAEIWSLYDPDTRWDLYEPSTALERVPVVDVPQTTITLAHEIRAAKGSRPSGPFVLNANSPQANGLVAWWPLGRKDFANVLTGRQLIDRSSDVTLTGATLGGLAASFNQTDSGLRQIDPPQVLTYPLTMSVWFRTNTGFSGSLFVLMGDFALPGGSDIDYLYIRHTATGDSPPNELWAVARSAASGSSANAVASAPIVRGEWNHAVAVFKSATDRAIYINGGNKGSDSTDISFPFLNSVNIGYHGRFGGTEFFGGDLADARLYNRALTDREIAALYDGATRWDLYGLPARRYDLGTAPPAGGTVTITVPTGTLSLTGAAPSLSQPVIATPGSGSLAFTGVAPSLATSIGVPSGALSLSGVAPTLVRSITVPAGSLTFTGVAPTVGQGTGYQVPAGSLTFTGVAPVLNIGRGVPAGTLTLTGQAPTVATQFVLAVPAGSLTFTGVAPSIVAAGNYVPSSGTLTLTGQAPTLVFRTSYAVPVGTLTLTGVAPATVIRFALVPPAGTLTLSGVAPTVSISVARAVPSGTLTFTGVAPSKVYRTVYDVSAGSLTFTGQAPTLAFRSSIIVPGGTLTFSGQAPSVSLVANAILPPTGTLTFTGTVPLVVRTHGGGPPIMWMWERIA